MRTRIFGPMLLVVAWAGYFLPLVSHPTEWLYSDYSDQLAEHLPAKLFLHRAYHATGELPLWCPNQFCGQPFVHDLQVGIFYPPNLVMLLLPESALGAALSWLIALHVLLAGLTMFAYARSRGFDTLGAVAAGAGYMFAGKWIMHLFLSGHTITIGLAWLPLVLLYYERALQPGRFRWSVAAGIVFALLLLSTHPQWALYAGVLIGLWVLALGRWAPGRWFLVGVSLVSVAVGLCAIQLLPTLSASGLTTRAGHDALQEWSDFWPNWFFAGALVPYPVIEPPYTWEAYGSCGVLTAMLAIVGAMALPRRERIGVAVVLLWLSAFAAGGGIYVQQIPPFGLFRMPSRMMLLLPLPLAYLAARGVMALATLPLRRVGCLACGLTLVFGLLPGLLRDFWCTYLPSEQGLPNPVCRTYLITLAIIVPAFLASLFAKPSLWRAGFVLLLLALDWYFVSGHPIRTRRGEKIYPMSQSESIVIPRLEADHERWRFLDGDLMTNNTDPQVPLGSAFGIGAPHSLVRGFDTPRGFNPLDVKHYREFLHMICDEPPLVEPLQGFGQPTIANLPVVNRNLFALMGVKYATFPNSFAIDSQLWQPIGTDPAPRSFNHYPGGILILPAHTVYESKLALPRVMLVPQAARLMPGEELARLRTTDFRTLVWLSGSGPVPPPLQVGDTGTATLRSYQPNRIEVELSGINGGVLVVNDVWYPGWECEIDGQAVPIERANHAFRAVALPAGAREAVFRFRPSSYRWGQTVSGVSLLGVVGVGVAWLVIRRRRRIP